MASSTGSVDGACDHPRYELIATGETFDGAEEVTRYILQQLGLSVAPSGIVAAE